MKLRKVGVILGGLALAAAVAIASHAAVKASNRTAQGPGGPPDQRRPGPPGLGAGGMIPLGLLDLTEAQKEQVRTIDEQERASTREYAKQLDDARKALGEATANGQFDEAKIRAIAAAQAQAMVELTVSGTRRNAAVYQILTAEQRAKLEQFRENHPGPRFGGPPPGPRP